MIGLSQINLGDNLCGAIFVPTINNAIENDAVGVEIFNNNENDGGALAPKMSQLTSYCCNASINDSGNILLFFSLFPILTEIVHNLQMNCQKK